MNELELEAAGYKKQYDYTQYSHDNHVNVIPEEAFRRLVADTFSVITDQLKQTYGPYGSTMMISDQSETTTTKDGWNLYNKLYFSHQYKREVYIAIKKIINRVNSIVGDGTTTCILLAEKIFNSIRPLLDNPDHKRNVEKILNDIEEALNNTDFNASPITRKLTKTSMFNIIRLASNYDDEIIQQLMDAFEPIVDQDGYVSAINQVIPDDMLRPYETSSRVSYEVQHIPGKYRVRIKMNPEHTLLFAKPTRVKVVMYNYTFGEMQWLQYSKRFNLDTPIFIIARSFDKNMDKLYANYTGTCSVMKQPLKIFLVTMEGKYLQDELSDLAAVCNTDIHRQSDGVEVDIDALPEYDISVFNYNCLCFYDVESPSKYINNLEVEIADEKSFVHRLEVTKRIRALSLDRKDSIIKIHAGTSLELQLNKDKIDDCTKVVESAFEFGTVPNLLFYGAHTIHDIMPDMETKYGAFGKSVCETIQSSIMGIFDLIWESKYGNDITNRDELKHVFYDETDGDQSFDILQNELIPSQQLGTSAQYDIEVLVASLSIVKYLLTSRALIFDCYTMQSQGDQGYYTRVD